MKLIYLLILSTIFYYSCDKVEGPFMEKKTNVINPIDTNTVNDTVYRKILIEDFTGHRCTNCPRAHEVIRDLSALYPSRIVPVGIHCGSFAAPFASGSKYRYDFRSIDGNEMEAFYQFMTYPVGLVNSIAMEEISSDSEWGTKVAAFINTPAKMKIAISSNQSIVNDTIVYSSTIKSTALSDFNNNVLFLVVFLREDSIQNWQTVFTVDSAKYMHRHVLRDALSDKFGDKIINGAFLKNSVIEKQYSFKQNSKWNSKQLSLVAYIYDSVTKEVFQVEEKDIHASK